MGTRRLMTVILFLLLVILFPQISQGQIQKFPITRPAEVDARDWELASGKRTGKGDLRCIDGGWYIGGIDRQWFLVISGPPRQHFVYSFVGLDRKQLAGTWGVKDGLALFSGTLKTSPVFEKGPAKSSPLRFGLNFHLLDDKVYFNVLRQDDRGTYHYERKWFFGSDPTWSPREHHQLTFTPDKQQDGKLTWQVKGTLIRWKEQGKEPERQVVDQKAVYVKANKDSWGKAPGQPTWLPEILRPHQAAKPGGQPSCYHLGDQHFGWVRGFVFE